MVPTFYAVRMQENSSKDPTVKRLVANARFVSWKSTCGNESYD